MNLADNNMLLTYYGDDFTGSTDVLEALDRAGVSAVLFLEPPTPEALARFPGARAVGVAGLTRSMAPDRLAAALKPALASLKRLGAPIVHYKVCSTFDSSPTVGSIGRAIDTGQSALDSPFVPVVVGAPLLARYVAFGNLFARSGLDSDIFRLDRHPTMRRHPTTPMDESDLRLHLARQTDKAIGLFDLLDLELPGGHDERLTELINAGSEIVLFDAVYDRHLERIGELLWRRASRGNPLFVVGSSGVEHALGAHWLTSGVASPQKASRSAEATGPVVAVSGSCSPVTDQQIALAVRRGFAEIALQTDRIADPEGADQERRDAVERAVRALQRGQSVILHTCRGPDDPRRQKTSARLKQRQPEAEAAPDSAQTLGNALGAILKDVVAQTNVRRAAVAGGDTSGYVARRLGIEALEMIAPMAPGAPLCRASSSDPTVDGLQLVFKGGQVGAKSFFLDFARA